MKMNLSKRRAAGAAVLLAAALLASCESPTGGGTRTVARMDVVAGDLQTDTVGTELPQPLVVRVLDERGHPVRGQIVNFVVSAGGGSVFAGASQTNQDGEARERWRLGTVAGDTQRVEVRAVDAATGAAQVFATFRAVGLPDAPASVAKLDDQSYAGTSGMPMADSVAVKVVDRYGNGVGGVQVAWAAAPGEGSLSPATSVTNAAGVARSLWTLGASGVGHATATVAGLTPAPLSALVGAGAPARVVASADSLSFTALRQTTKLQATAYDAFGNALSGEVVRWMSLDTAVVQVHTFDGWVTAWGPGTGRVVAYAQGGDARDTVIVRVRQQPATLDIQDRSAYAGRYHTAPGDSIRLYVKEARDANGYAITNPELTWTSSDPSVARVGPTGYFVPLQLGTFTATVTAGSASDAVTVEVRPAHTAASIAAGDGTLCLLQADGATWCWGTFVRDDDFPGEYVLPGSATDAAVGPKHVCFLLVSAEAYCAGFGNYGELGDGRYQRQPGDTAGWFGDVRGEGVVRGGLRYTSLAVGRIHSCGVAQDGVAYCWGRGVEGQLGSGVQARALDPTPVTGSETLRFKAIYAMESGTCAIATDNTLFCWGMVAGQNLGATPVPVQAPRAFSQIAMGGTFVCGLDTAGKAWCWGTTTAGQLGNGVTSGTWTAAQPVSGGHTFTQLRASYAHTCGLTAGGEAMCWGANGYAQLGTGAITPSENTPQPPGEPRRFTEIEVGSLWSCGLSLNQVAVCWGQMPGYKDSEMELHPAPF